MSTQIETLRQVRLRGRLGTVLNLACRLTLAVIFGVSSIQKAIFPTAFEDALKAYHLNHVIIQMAIPTIPFLEFALTLTLLFGVAMRTSALVSALLLTMYTVLIGFELITGNVNHGCGCFIGVSNSQSWVGDAIGGSTITIADVVRDLVLLLVALAVCFTHDPKLGLDKFWTNSREYWRWYHGRGYLTGTLILVFTLSMALSAITEGNLSRTTNRPLSVARDFNPAATIAVGQQAPDFSLDSVDGKEYSLDAYRGKVVLLEFFAIWCSNCHAEAPIINRIEEKFSASKFQALSVIASSYSKDYEASNGTDITPYTAEDIRWYEQTYHVKAPILIDPYFKVTNEYISKEFPNLVVISPQGRIKAIYVGPTSYNRLSSTIQSLLS